MVIDLEQEKQNGLDESQLAKQVMLLMGLSAECNGFALADVPESAKISMTWKCRDCGYRGDYLNPHPRVPKPLREVRDELLEWLKESPVILSTANMIYGTHHPDGSGITLFIEGENDTAVVSYVAIKDEPVALAMGAVRLMEKQNEEAS